MRSAGSLLRPAAGWRALLFAVGLTWGCADKTDACPDLDDQECRSAYREGELICDDCGKMWSCADDGWIRAYYPCSCIEESGGISDAPECQDVVY